jgi:hypothetical protein
MGINPLPGLTLGYSDICIQAAAEEIYYEELILEILYLAAGRGGYSNRTDGQLSSSSVANL